MITKHDYTFIILLCLISFFGNSQVLKNQHDLEASPLCHVGANTPPTLFLNSSVDRMHAGRDDFRKVLDQYQIYSEVHTFADALPFFLFIQSLV